MMKFKLFAGCTSLLVFFSCNKPELEKVKVVDSTASHNVHAIQDLKHTISDSEVLFSSTTKNQIPTGLDKELIELEFAFNLAILDESTRDIRGRIVRDTVKYEVGINVDGRLNEEDELSWIKYHEDLIRSKMISTNMVPRIVDVVRPEHDPEHYSKSRNLSKSGDTVNIYPYREVILSYILYLEPHELNGGVVGNPNSPEKNCEFKYNRNWEELAKKLNFTKVCRGIYDYWYRSDFETIRFYPNERPFNQVDVMNDYYQKDYLPHAYSSLISWKPSQQDYYGRRIWDLWDDHKPASPVRGKKQMHDDVGIIEYGRNFDANAQKTVYFLQSVQTYFNTFPPEELEPIIPLDQLPKIGR